MCSDSILLRPGQHSWTTYNLGLCMRARVRLCVDYLQLMFTGSAALHSRSNAGLDARPSLSHLGTLSEELSDQEARLILPAAQAGRQAGRQTSKYTARTTNQGSHASHDTRSYEHLCMDAGR